MSTRFQLKVSRDSTADLKSQTQTCNVSNEIVSMDRELNYSASTPTKATQANCLQIDQE